MQTLQDFSSAAFINRVVKGLIKVSWAGSVPEERRAGTLHWFWALISSLPLCVRQIRASIFVQLCACRRNPKWQPLQRPNGGEKSECQKFSAAPSEPKLGQICPPVPFAGLAMDLSSRVFRSIDALPTTSSPTSRLLLSLTVCSQFLWKQ